MAAVSAAEPALPRRGAPEPTIAAIPLQKETQPAPLPQDSVPSHELEHHTATHGQKPSRPFGLGAVLVTLGIAGAALFALMRAVLRKHSPTTPDQSSSTPAGRPVYTRVVEDGFWIEGDAIARGATLLCKYLANGKTVEDQVSFEPGPEGHFVFTGAKPTHVSVVYLDNQNSYSTSTITNSAAPIRRPSPSPRRSTSTTPDSHLPPAY